MLSLIFAIKLSMRGLFIFFILLAHISYSKNACVGYFASRAQVALIDPVQGLITKERFEDFIYDEGGARILKSLMAAPSKRSKVLNEFLKDAIARMEIGYRKPILTYDEKKMKPSAAQASRNILELVSGFARSVSAERDLSYREYTVLVDLLNRVHEVSFNFYESSIESPAKLKSSVDFNTQELKTEISKLQKNGFGRYQVKRLLKVEHNFPIAQELDYMFFFLSLADSFFIQGISAQPFITFDGDRTSAYRFTSHDEEAHNAANRTDLGYLEDTNIQSLRELKRIVNFLKSIRKTMTDDDRYYAMAFVFEMSHEEAKLVELIDIFETGVIEMILLKPHFANAAYNMRRDKVVNADKLSQIQVQNRILKAFKSLQLRYRLSQN